MRSVTILFILLFYNLFKNDTKSADSKIVGLVKIRCEGYLIKSTDKGLKYTDGYKENRFALIL